MCSVEVVTAGENIKRKCIKIYERQGVNTKSGPVNMIFFSLVRHLKHLIFFNYLTTLLIFILLNLFLDTLYRGVGEGSKVQWVPQSVSQ